jgi:voltage-gated potassium channel
MGVEPRSERVAHAFEKPMLVASALTIPVMIVEAAGVRDPWKDVAAVANWVIWLAFLTELVVMLAVVPDRKAWLLAHPIEVLVTVLTPPFLTSVFQSLRALRLLRLARLLRLTPLLRFIFTLQGLRYTALFTFVVALAGGLAFQSVEQKETFGDGLYLAVNAMTTLGYGRQPETTSGKIIAVVLLLVGLLFVAVLTGALAQRFLAREVKVLEEEVDEIRPVELASHMREISARVQRLEELLARLESQP